jgi:hypothetical protein
VKPRLKSFISALNEFRKVDLWVDQFCVLCGLDQPTAVFADLVRMYLTVLRTMNLNFQRYSLDILDNQERNALSSENILGAKLMVRSVCTRLSFAAACVLGSALPQRVY